MSEYNLRNRKDKDNNNNNNNNNNNEEEEDENTLPNIIKLQKVENFRDLGGYITENGRRVKLGVIYRAARLENASALDREFLEENIKSIIDLRDKSEQRKTYRSATPHSKSLYNNFDHRILANNMLIQADKISEAQNICVRVFCSKKKRLAKPIRLTLPDEYDSDDDNDEYDSLLTNDIKRRYMIPLGPKKSLFDFMNSRLSCCQKVRFAFNFFCCCSTDRAVAVVLPVFDTLGLFGLSKMMIQDRTTGIAAVLKLVAQPHLYPIVFHCMHGKDRTGLVAALILCLLGVPREEVLKDYAISERHLSPDTWDKEHTKHLSEEWKLSPPKVMRDTLAYLESKHGSIEQFCTDIGFGPEWQNQLQLALLE